nr:basic salivary proline-rich protein 2-like [Penaeus vannamei]
MTFISDLRGSWNDLRGPPSSSRPPCCLLLRSRPPGSPSRVSVSGSTLQGLPSSSSTFQGASFSRLTSCALRLARPLSPPSSHLPVPLFSRSRTSCGSVLGLDLRASFSVSPSCCPRLGLDLRGLAFSGRLRGPSVSRVGPSAASYFGLRPPGPPYRVHLRACLPSRVRPPGSSVSGSNLRGLVSAVGPSGTSVSAVDLQVLLFGVDLRASDLGVDLRGRPSRGLRLAGRPSGPPVSGSTSGLRLGGPTFGASVSRRPTSGSSAVSRLDLSGPPSLVDLRGLPSPGLDLPGAPSRGRPPGPPFRGSTFLCLPSPDSTFGALVSESKTRRRLRFGGSTSCASSVSDSTIRGLRLRGHLRWPPSRESHLRGLRLRRRTFRGLVSGRPPGLRPPGSVDLRGRPPVGLPYRAGPPPWLSALRGHLQRPPSRFSSVSGPLLGSTSKSSSSSTSCASFSVSARPQQGLGSRARPPGPPFRGRRFGASVFGVDLRGLVSDSTSGPRSRIDLRGPPFRVDLRGPPSRGHLRGPPSRGRPSGPPSRGRPPGASYRGSTSKSSFVSTSCDSFSVSGVDLQGLLLGLALPVPRFSGTRPSGPSVSARLRGLRLGGRNLRGASVSGRPPGLRSRGRPFPGPPFSGSRQPPGPPSRGRPSAASVSGVSPPGPPSSSRPPGPPSRLDLLWLRLGSRPPSPPSSRPPVPPSRSRTRTFGLCLGRTFGPPSVRPSGPPSGSTSGAFRSGRPRAS